MAADPLDAEDPLDALPVLTIAGFRAAVDAYALERPSQGADAWLWCVSLLGPQQSVKALWARLVKGEMATLSLEAFGRTHFCRIAPEGPKAWRFHTASLPAVSGYQGVLVPEAARYAAERPDFLPLLPAWADWLWARARKRQEAVSLVSYGLSAYRCRPDPDALAADLGDAVRRGLLRVPDEEAPPRPDQGKEPPR